MCSIFGIGLFNGHKLTDSITLTGVVSRLFKEAEVGGQRASGLSIMRERSVHVLRRPLSGSQLVATDEYLDFMRKNLVLGETDSNRAMSIIGHCRWPTQGPPENNLNNHPQVIDNIIGVHNGIITNDYSLFKSFDKVINRKAQVDTEIIFQLINHFNKAPGSKTIDSITTALPYLGGSYACGMQNTKHPHNLYIFRHSNPARILCYKKLGLILFATREYFITQAFEQFVEDTEGEGEEIELMDNYGIAFNLWNHASCTFPFQDRRAAEELKHNVA